MPFERRLNSAEKVLLKDCGINLREAYVCRGESPHLIDMIGTAEAADLTLLAFQRARGEYGKNHIAFSSGAGGVYVGVVVRGSLDHPEDELFRWYVAEDIDWSVKKATNARVEPADPLAIGQIESHLSVAKGREYRVAGTYRCFRDAFAQARRLGYEMGGIQETAGIAKVMPNGNVVSVFDAHLSLMKNGICTAAITSEKQGFVVYAERRI